MRIQAATLALHANDYAAARTIARSVLSIKRTNPKVFAPYNEQATLILALAEANPELKASVFDLPSVAATANEQLARTEYANRLSALPGNCFEDNLPTGVDAFLTRNARARSA